MMGRQIRRVPADWMHPKNDKGHIIPMHDHFPYNEEEIEEGLADGWLDNEPPNYGCDVMPQWSDEERTHFQLYENTTEGTPLTPVFATPEEVARYAADNHVSTFGSMTATYEEWLPLCRSRGYGSVGMVYTPETGLRSGVVAMAEEK